MFRRIIRCLFLAVFVIFGSEYPDPLPGISGTSPSRIMAAGRPRIFPNHVSVPSDFPELDISVNDHPSEGKYFFNNEWRSNSYIIILENSGFPYFYLKTSDSQRDFKVQPNGLLTSRFKPLSAFIGMDSSYAVVDTFFAAPGYDVDEHELLVQKNGHYLIVAIRYQRMDMSRIVPGGNPFAGVSFSDLQELDANGKLVFSFISRDHIDMLDYIPLENNNETLTSNYIRFPHMNSIDIDDDGEIIISCRHVSAVYKISRETGDIIWQLGGKRSDFTFVNDPLNGFSGQHACSALGNRHYLLFDNGNNHKPQVSRAVEYELDMTENTATLVWEYIQEPGHAYSHYMGNAQRLANGNTLINWAVPNWPKATEVRSNGQKVFEMNFADGSQCYRTQKFDWNVPACKPYLIAESHSSHVALIFNQFGDTNIAYYNIYAGSSPDPAGLLDTSRLTLKNITELENLQTYYFRVTSVNPEGKESPYSNQQTVVTHFLESGENMVLNSGFSLDDSPWELELSGGAWVTPGIENGIYHMKITGLGTDISDIQFRQNGLELIQGKEYLFEFDAWANPIMAIDAKIEKAGSPWINYGKIGTSAILLKKQHFSYSFIMEDVTDLNARIVFNSNDRTGDLYIDNVSLIFLDPSRIKDKVSAPVFRISGSYPNPFNARTHIRFMLVEQCDIRYTIFDLRGRCVMSEDQGIRGAGNHAIAFEPGNLASGLYICRIEGDNLLGKKYSERVKLLFIR